MSKKRRKIRQVSIREVPLSRIRPAPENRKLYRPINADDPEIRALAESIKSLGVTEPLVLSKDYYILSGHRRRAAARVAGLKSVPCRFEDITHNDPRFLVLLREFNRQRVKTIGEQLREEVISANPDEAHRALLEQRRKAARVDVETVPLREYKRRAAISGAKRPFLNAVLDVPSTLLRAFPA